MQHRMDRSTLRPSRQGNDLPVNKAAFPVRLRCFTLLVLFAAACAQAPVRRQEARIASGGVTLSGTLIAPAAGGRHPAVLLLHGSGPDGRQNPYHGMLVSAFVAAARRRVNNPGDSLIFIPGAGHVLQIQGLQGVLRRRPRNRPLSLGRMVRWAARQVAAPPP